MINQGYDINQDEQYLTEEQKRRRREALSGLVGGESISDVTSNYLSRVGQDTTNRFNQVQQTFENPVQAMQDRMGVSQGPMGPVMPTDVAQERQRQLETGPVMPQNIAEQRAMMTPEVQQVQQYQPPVPGPEVQVAGPTQLPPQPQQTWMDELAQAGTDQTKLAKFMASTDIPEAKQAAGRMIAQQYNQQKQQAEAEQFANKAVQSGDLLPLMKKIQQEKGEGSYLKAYLYSRLGLNELAKDEQQKLGAGTTYQVAYDPQGNKALMEVTAQGLPVKGYNEKLQELTPEEFGKFAVGAAPKHAFQMPSVHGAPVQRTNPQTGQVETGTLIYDPMTRTNYVQVGNQRQDTTGWTTMAQTPQSVYGAAGAGAQGKQAAETGQQQKPLPPMAGVPGMAVPPQGAGAGAPQAVTQPQQQAQQLPSGGVKLVPQNRVPLEQQPTVAPQPSPLSTVNKPVAPTTPAQPTGGAVTQMPGESYSSFKQREKIAQEQAAANIQANKELRVAEEKPPAEQKGKNVATDIKNQRFADETYGLIKPISEAIKASTGSGIGTKVDKLASQIGQSTKGQEAIAQLEVLSYPILSNVPRFEGAQSDIDVKNYQKAAGDFANSEKPVAVRLAALQAMVTILKKYDKEGKNDWSFGETQSQQPQIKIIKREKVQ